MDRCLRAMLAVSGLLGGVASAQDDWFDDFESYPLGEICGRGGWEEWDGSENVCAEVSDEQAFSGEKSLLIYGATDRGGQEPNGDDMVRRLDVKGGVWTLSMMTFVPKGAEGLGWVIVLSQYPTQKNWITQILLDADFGVVANAGRGDGEADLITGRWVELRIEYDFKDNVQALYYDTKAFAIDVPICMNTICQPEELGIQALDLYAGEPFGGTTGMYFDDTALSGSSCEPCDANCDGSVDLTDVEPFVALVLGQGKPCDTCSGDTNADGSIDLSDVEGFIECLL